MKDRKIGLIGLGVMFMWCCALLPWIDLWNSSATLKQALGFFGAALVSLSGLAVLLYASHLEKRVGVLEGRLHAEKESAAFARQKAANVTHGPPGL